MRYILFATCFFSLFYASAQNKPQLYNQDELPQTLLSNPGAAISFDKHIGVPLLSGFSFQVGSSGVSVYNIFRDDIPINAAINEALLDLSSTDYFNMNVQLELLSFGWRSSNSDIYYSGGVYHEIDAFSYFPKDLATLAYNGNADYIDVPFEFSELAFTAESLSVYHFGINNKVNNSWQLGARAKVYMSVANVNSINNRGDFTTRTTPNGPNFYTHTLRNVSLVANTSGVESFYDDEIDTDVTELVSNAFLSKNYGFGLDIGLTHFINEQWSLSASIIDLGFINHREDVRNFTAAGNYETNGIELTFPALIEGDEFTDYWQNIEDEFEDSINLSDSLSNDYTSWRPVKFNTSLQYAFGEDRSGECNCKSGGDRKYINNVGLHINSIKRPRGLQTAITAYYDRKWNSGLLTRVTYTYDKRSATNLGFLVSTKINKFNLYLAADNLVQSTNIAKARGASLQLGMQLVFENK